MRLCTMCGQPWATHLTTCAMNIPKVENQELKQVELLARIAQLEAERDALKAELGRAVAAEREACKQVCTDLRHSIVARGHPADFARGWIKDCEDGIAARGAK